MALGNVKYLFLEFIVYNSILDARDKLIVIGNIYFSKLIRYTKKARDKEKRNHIV